jgi:hypothetical protein
MAVYYVDSAAGSNTSPYDTWAKAATSLIDAAALAAAGEDIYVASSHAETAASAKAIVFTNSTTAAPIRVVCTDKLATPPLLANMVATPTGSVTTTGNNAITVTGCAYIYGLIFSCGTTAASPSLTTGGAIRTDIVYDNCALKLAATSSPLIVFGTATTSVGCRVTLNNTTVRFASITAAIQCISLLDLTIKNVASFVDTGGTIPTNLFSTGSTGGGRVLLEGVDLSGMSTKMLTIAQANGLQIHLKDCKEPASYSATNGVNTPTSPSSVIFKSRTGSSGVAYNIEKYDVRGTQLTETTCVRTGGAQVNGTGVAMKITGTSSAKFTAPFESTPLSINNTTTGASVIVTVYGYWAGASIPTNEELWLEISYLGSAATPVATFDVSTRKAQVLSTAATVAVTDSSTWGVGGTTKFKWAVTLSSPAPNLAGHLSVVVKSASTNATWIDPTVSLA